MNVVLKQYACPWRAECITSDSRIHEQLIQQKFLFNLVNHVYKLANPLGRAQIQPIRS